MDIFKGQEADTVSDELQKLIDSPPCDLQCTENYWENGKKVTCCHYCKQNYGFWKPFELYKRVRIGQLTFEEADFIIKAIEERALGSNGCKLERYMRSKECRRFNCKDEDV